MIRQAVCAQCGAANRIAAGKPTAAARCGRCHVNLDLAKPLDVSDAELAAHLAKTGGLVLVDVWADWCDPCKAMAPHFAKAAGMLAGEARLLKLDADRSTTSGQLGVYGIPALLLFRDVRLIDRQAGVMQAGALVAWVRANVARAAG